MTSLEHRQVQANGIRLHVATAGDPKRPAVMFLHGFPEGWSSWRSIMEALADDYFVLAPDWVAEVLSPSTVVIDRGRKLAAYARSQVRHVWFVDPVAQTLEVLRLDGETYRVVMVASGEEVVRAEPFDAIELGLAVLWAR